MRIPLLLPLLAIATAACAADTTQPGSTVAARYIAAVPPAGSNTPPRGALIITVTQGTVIDELSVAGAALEIVLDANGRTSGHLFIPATASRDGLNADLAGSWSLANGVVTLQQNADTFLRDMPLTVQGNDLVGDRTFGDTRVQLTLVRQGPQ